MDKLKMHSPDLSRQNIEKIRALFQNCVTESVGSDGKTKLVVDFDQLKQELSSTLVDGPQERYHLNWPGKREALLIANAPIAKTFRPSLSKSVNFDNSQNLFIEGDNLEALKLLQETYLGKVKMIYIDPPYNTGRDFLYSDDFSDDVDTYLLQSNQTSDKKLLVTNLESNGRFHSDWLSMIYPRIKLARNLLSDDGVIFISIDDEEYVNLKKVCDEIFGESNFIETFVWIKKTAPNNVVVGSVHEYILMYAKNIEQVKLYLLPRDEEKDKDYKNPDNDPRGRWKPDNLTAAAKGGRSTPSLIYKITNPQTGQEHWPPEGRMWAVNKEEMDKKIQDGTVYWGKNGDGKPMDKRFLSQTRDGTVAQTLLADVGTNSSASKDLSKLFDGVVVFETPKPVELIERFLKIATKDSDIVLDFFAGSCTTAEAIFKANSLDGGSRKFILVQLPETLPDTSEAIKLGMATLADVGRERINRARKAFTNSNLDTGFRALEIDTSNLEDVHYSPDNYVQGELNLLISNFKKDRTNLDLLFQVLIDWGIDLTYPITSKTLNGREIFLVNENALVACFDKNINEELVTELSKLKPLRVVFKDESFISDSVKINTEQIFKQLSPQTEIKTV